MSPSPLSASNPLFLGSSSPRRRDILTGLGIPIRVAAPDVAEIVKPREEPSQFLERVVADKLSAAQMLADGCACAGVLVADTIVVLDGQILGKPRDQPDAVRLLTQLCGRTHQVFTRYALAASGGEQVSRTVSTEVSLRSANAIEVSAYAATGEGLDKAGAYAAQGIGAFLIERIIGSYTNVVGLPACEVVCDLVALELLDGFPRRSFDT